MQRHRRALVWYLRIAAAVLLLALFAVFLPFEWMDAIHRGLGLGDLPKAPIVGYLTRSLSLLYALFGCLCLAVSFDVDRYLPAASRPSPAGRSGSALLGSILWWNCR